MLVAEAVWLRDALMGCRLEEISPLLNVGSGTATFRMAEQPWIHREVFLPLESRGCRVLHLDVKERSGAEIVGDLTDPGTRAAAMRVGARAVICSNVLEHVADPYALARLLPSLVPSGGRLFVTAPYRQPHHDDPIDNGLRPAPEELAAMMPGGEVTRADVIMCHTWAWYLSRRPSVMLRACARLATPFWKPRDWWSLARVVPWLWRPFGASCVALRKL